MRSKAERKAMGITYPVVSSSSASVPDPPAAKTATTAAAATAAAAVSHPPPSSGDANTASVKVEAPGEPPAARANSGKGPATAGHGGRVPAPAEKAQDGGKAAAAAAVVDAAATAAATTTTTPAFLPFQVGRRGVFGWVEREKQLVKGQSKGRTNDTGAKKRATKSGRLSCSVFAIAIADVVVIVTGKR